MALYSICSWLPHGNWIMVRPDIKWTKNATAGVLLPTLNTLETTSKLCSFEHDTLLRVLDTKCARNSPREPNAQNPRECTT